MVIASVSVASLALADEKRIPTKPVQDASNRGEKAESMDARGLLEKGRKSGVLPEGMVVRIGACLGERLGRDPDDKTPDGMVERWEFTSRQVHRVAPEERRNPRSRDDSRPFDSKGICQDLLEGKAIEIHARKGEGPEIGFVGTHYGRGSRSIEVEWNGKTILSLHETNGPMLYLYRESDARAFGALYERLASQARDSFKSQKAEAK